MQQNGTYHYKTLVLNDRSLRPVIFPSGVTQLDKLRLEGQGTLVEFPGNITITITSLQADGNHTLTVKNGAAVTLEAMHEHMLGIQCSFVVESGGTLNLPPKEPVYMTSTNPVLEVSGLVTGNEVVIGDKGRLSVNAGGELKMTRIELKDDATAEFKSGSKVGTAGDSQFKLERFVVGVKSRVVFDTENVVIDATLFEMKWQSSCVTTSPLKNITVTSDDIIVGSDATIDVSGGGRGGSEQTAVGGSYGGQGGGDEVGQVYGSVTQPVDYGRGPSAAHGGGIITLQATRHLTIDGKVTSDGDRSDSTGAGSGGSVRIVGQSISGLGLISANGGNGGLRVGGGSGGRVAIQISDSLDNFQGTASAFGGNGAQSGAAGTVYKQYVNAGINRTDIVIDNNHLETTSKTNVSVPPDLGRLELRRDAVVTFDSATGDISFDDVIGDYSGTVLVTAGQTVRLSTTAGLMSPFALACKVRVEEGANIALPQKVLFTDASAGGPPNLELRGTLLNVREMYVGENARVLVASSANTWSSSVADPAGTVSFMQLHVTSGGVLDVGKDTDTRTSIIAADLVQVHYNGHISGRNLSIEATLVKVAYKAMVDVDYGGQAEGSGSGQQGSGGSYGGCGGKLANGGVPLERVIGSMYEADTFGAIGGNATNGPGGAGGGILKVTASNKLQLDGTLSAQGHSGVSGGGGGSGGSVRVDTAHVDGSGSVSVRGGDGGIDGGGGGGGGRIVLKVTNSTTGKMVTLVTQGGHSTTGWAGGSGTVVIKSKVRNAPYTSLHIDNGARNDVTKIEGTYLKQGDNGDVTLDELYLGDNVYLHVIDSDTNLTAHSLSCVGSAIIHVSDSLIFTADTSLSAVTIPCSFEIQQHGEIRLPSKVTFLGNNNLFAGTL